MRRRLLTLVTWASGLLISIPPSIAAEPSRPLPDDLAPYFAPPEKFRGEFSSYRSPLLFDDGTKVETPADWPKRRQEILRYWHGAMGEWPAVMEEPKVEVLESERRDNFVQSRVRFALSPKGDTTTGYLQVPDGEGKRPAVLVVYYDPETGAGLNDKERRDFGYQLAKRGFVTLSIGLGGSYYYPSQKDAQLQPLSALAYVAANAYHVLASRPEVDPARIGVTGHSYGGKWAMFASCLYDKFACAAWSDGGIVFDEKRGNVNFWEPWYLGYEKEFTRKRGLVRDDAPRTGAYKRFMAEGRDLHELHALMAPRPFLVSGGSEDPPARWGPLNHAIAVNRLLGYENRVAMTNRPSHGPTEESNEALFRFFEHFLKPETAK